ncbi:MAG: hypothetical protein JST67_03685 [Bacteroidetes bacterium]|nr:hypothetical protein [Bacteroidota bacterium]
MNTLTDKYGTLFAQQDFDPWGRPRNPQTWDYTAPANPLPAWLTRGYTGHEYLPQFGLINMNGRMYDPLNARMLSADNEVQYPTNTQSYNRYTYCLNNPLKYADPSGYSSEGVLTGGSTSMSSGTADFSATGPGYRNHYMYAELSQAYWDKAQENSTNKSNYLAYYAQHYNQKTGEWGHYKTYTGSIAYFSDGFAHTHTAFVANAGEKMEAPEFSSMAGTSNAGDGDRRPPNKKRGSAQSGGGYAGQVNYNGYNVSSEALQGKLLQFSQYAGQPIDVTSGDRSAVRNKAAGGANASRHLYGDAVDIKIQGMTNRQVSILANQSALFNTVIYYPSIDAVGALRPHVHLDLNPTHNNLFLLYTPLIIDGTVTKNQYSPFK